ncbi:carboxypeptidase N subunit 2 [Hyalella azteca]|uniref:Carboxypeptidase N subunit 2 n=1 Tax=Hyalella azteca TaxID=294128 RepID=A0A8B7N2X3_HYAAZ|nr:carboxypeptidase N subunit 2 [Hyalella azteca]
MRGFLTALCLASCSLHVAAFLGFPWGSAESDWNLCASVDGRPCDCPDDVFEADRAGLDCSYRDIGYLHDGAVVPLRFKKVDLSNNRLRNFTATTFSSNNSHVTELDMAANLLSVIPPNAFVNLPGLLKLDLSNNEIQIITNDSFNGIANLSSLDLSHNKLHVFEANTFMLLPRLQRLQLKYNPVNFLPDSLFTGLFNLTHLDLTHLQLVALHNELFTDTTSLEELSLAFNELGSVPTKALFKLSPSLKVLDLSGNLFTELTSYSIYNMKRLHELYLRQLIYLKAIDDYAINECNNLRNLELQLLPRISFISSRLSYTRLETLPEGLLNWTLVKSLELSHNQWRCDCHMAWIKGSPVEKLVGENFYCSLPNRLRGSPLSQLKEEDFVCKASDDYPDPKQWGVVAVLLLVGVLASITTVAFLFYRRNGFLCRKTDNYSQLKAASRETITVVDSSAVSNTDAELNVA